jgi:hypothetical protein
VAWGRARAGGELEQGASLERQIQALVAQRQEDPLAVVGQGRGQRHGGLGLRRSLPSRVMVPSDLAWEQEFAW